MGMSIVSSTGRKDMGGLYLQILWRSCAEG